MTERQIGNLAVACHEIQREFHVVSPYGLFDYKEQAEWDNLDVYEQSDIIKKVQKALETINEKPTLKDNLFLAIVRATVRMNNR